MKKLCSALDVAICAIIAWVLLWNCFAAVAFDGDLYYDLQMRAGVLDEAGVTQEELRQLDSELAFALEHPHTDTLIGMLERDGEAVSAFNERERRHISDCRRLIGGFQDATQILGTLAAALLLLRILLRRHAPRLPGAGHVWLGFLLPLLPIAIFGIWAAMDFGSAFTFFHRMLFTNDLWLLNPATDLLIRICPESMFVSMGARIATRAGAALLGVPALYTLLCWYRLRVQKR